jgi:SlyX protein
MPTDADPSEARFVTVESKLAYQEKTVADLNDMVIGQGREIDELRKRLETLERFIREYTAVPSAPNERPPHY